MSIMQEVTDFLVRHIGATATIILQDGMTFVAGVLLGLLLGVLIYTWATRRAYVDRDLDSEIAIMYVKETNSYAANPKTFWEYVDTLVLIIWCKLKGKRKFQYLSLRDARHVKNTVIVLTVLAIIFILIGLALTLNILAYDPPELRELPITQEK